MSQNTKDIELGHQVNKQVDKFCYLGRHQRNVQTQSESKKPTTLSLQTAEQQMISPTA